MATDLTTTYLGLPLKTPLVAAACPLTADLDRLQALQEAGVSAAVLPSLFEEQVEHEEQELAALLDYRSESRAGGAGYFPEVETYNTGADTYLMLLEELRREVSIPLIASLNGHTEGGWVRFAEMLQEAGADALELNVYYVPTSPDMSSDDVENRYLKVVEGVRRAIQIPLAVKIGPFFSSIPAFATRLANAGADGLVLFNRYLEPDIDIDLMRVRPDLVLSEPHEVRLPIRWISILRDRLDLSLAANSGIHDAPALIKTLLAGADVSMVATGFLQQGPELATTMLEELKQWMAQHDFSSVRSMRGALSHRNAPDPAAIERANYMHAIVSYPDPTL